MTITILSKDIKIIAKRMGMSKQNRREKAMEQRKRTRYDEAVESEERIKNAADRIVDIAKELHLTIYELENAIERVKYKAHITD